MVKKPISFCSVPLANPANSTKVNNKTNLACPGYTGTQMLCRISGSYVITYYARGQRLPSTICCFVKFSNFNELATNAYKTLHVYLA